eukprot:NODE_9585_length_1413_cov_3.326594.p2 GENE.NODE_9585_length_1413_cov_3.326594~~NODE_9585_length_1413_cov_3.326594.p2  ORF type:complete len:190 (+),score=31.08 NODE_9585_length_1413_cov_3.326594:262-831(+)
MLRLNGILPWHRTHGGQRDCFSACYQCAAVFVITLAAVLQVLTCLHAEPLRALPQSGGLYSDLSLALGALFGHILLHIPAGRQALGECHSMLVSCAQQGGLLERWQGRMRNDTAFSAALWCVAVCARVVNVVVLNDVKAGDACGLIAFAVAGGFLLGVVFCLLHICRFLSIMVETFCCRLVVSGEVPGK